MYAKVYNFKFPGLSEAKVAATFCSENLGKKIVPFNIRSLNISIGKCGSISINLKKTPKIFFKILKKLLCLSRVIFQGYMYTIMNLSLLQQSYH